jgi:acyl-[acyl-carrier-protein]-phospholipid O-acyltransferase/long-chain-fatty-acid--[acyl-carrier-protein] ligase
MTSGVVFKKRLPMSYPLSLLHYAFFETARRHWTRKALADSTGQELTYGRALTAAVLFARAIRRRTPGETMIGLLLPASVGGALGNIATLAAGRVPVNLNFTAGSDAMRVAIDRCRIRTVLTSRAFLQKAGLSDAVARSFGDGITLCYLEDLRAAISASEKLIAFSHARLAPMAMLRRWYGAPADTSRTDPLATVIFSSGSTGQPKGVMLSHRNILSNIEGLAEVYRVGAADCFIGVLPFFHSFGLTGTLWFPLLAGCTVVYHPNPMDAKTIGELAEAHRGTFLIATPTFANAYLRRCTREQFAHLRYVIVGAEKLRAQLADAFKAQFGVALLEGYGCTEMSPVVAVNHPDAPGPGVGPAVPGVTIRVVDQHTGEGPLVDREGLILVKGPNLMQGYLDDPALTDDVMRDGWYVTGDIGSIDARGRLTITDRLSRFSKIGGEMVPHLKIEDAINTILGEACSAVTSVPDDTRGERLVAFYTRADVAPADLWESLGRTDLPKLWLPRKDHVIPIDAIPSLGTGKVDLRGLRELALKRAP